MSSNQDKSMLSKPDNLAQAKKYLLDASKLDTEALYASLSTNPDGLDSNSVRMRIARFGKNNIAHIKPKAWYWMLLTNFNNPFVLVLFFLGSVCILTNDTKGAILVSAMVLLAVLLRFFQEYRSSRAAEALRAMVRIKTTVGRIAKVDKLKSLSKKKEIPLEDLVPGDIVYLTAGDMVPADIRVTESKDLFISQAALTGESMPVEKHFLKVGTIIGYDNKENLSDPLSINNLCFMGTSIISGYGKGVVINTGEFTYFGSLANDINTQRPQTSFDKGINAVTWLLIKFICIMVPIIFVINGILKGNWQESFLFSIAVAIGITPEMLPMIVTTNLAKGAVAMSKLKVIVKKLNSIQSLGAMNILCTDKTGTLTQDKIILDRFLDANGSENICVLEYGYINSFFQSGLKNMLDIAVLDHAQLIDSPILHNEYKKIDEIPFDFVRKRMSVVVRRGIEPDMLICKGAAEELIEMCTLIDRQEEIIQCMTKESKQDMLSLARKINADGFRVIAVAYRKILQNKPRYSIDDEKDLVFLGLMAFLDPPKETARGALQLLSDYNINVKVLTGDTDIITQSICRIVNLPYGNTLVGAEIDLMTDLELSTEIEKTTIFAKLSPMHKARIIKLLKSNGNIVGYLGDGINDAAALREADVGISVDTATDIARESADIILLEKSLLVLSDGVIKGREVYGNIIKYIKMTVSSKSRFIELCHLKSQFNI
jgi:Mg2+-importing ATPase